MIEMIRCPACRGTKKVPRLGGVIGDCDTCKGKGQIELSNKPVKVIPESVADDVKIVAQVADVGIASKIEPEPIPVELISDSKSETRKAIFTRKKG